MAVTDETTHSARNAPSTPLGASAADHPQPFAPTAAPVENPAKPCGGTQDSARDAIGLVGPRQTGDSCPSDVVGLTPGACVADGRYRLLLFHGGPEGLQFWQALDTTLGRQVALTLIAPDGILPGEYVQEVLT